jgi:hypothetical protein
MRTSSRLLQLTAALAVGGLLAGGGYAIGASSNQTIHGCVISRSHQLLIKTHCGRGESTLVWNRQGAPGRTGQIGPQGPPGAAAWATVSPGASGPIVLNSQNLTVKQNGNGVFTLTAGGPCTTGRISEVVTPLADNVDPAGLPVAYVVTPTGSANVFEVVTGGLSNRGAFTQGNTEFNVAAFCKQS